MSTTPQLIEPNLYDLHGKGLKIHYSTTSIAGVPLLSVEQKGTTKSFRGDDIRVVDTPVGRLVTVTLEAVPDLKTVTLSIAIPGMNLSQYDGSIDTFAVITTSRTSIGGPALVHGQLDLYETENLTGKAAAVVF